MAENFGIENPLEKVQEELKELEEKEHQLEEGEKQRNRLNSLIGITISIYAVLTAAAGMKESQITTDSLLEMDHAVLLQAQASDQWGYYDSKSIKNDVTKSLTLLLPALTNQQQAKNVQDQLQKNMSKFEADKDDAQKKATELEKSRDEKIKHTAALVIKHRNAGLAVTFMQIAIVLGSVASILRKKTLWIGSMGVALIGLSFLVPLFLH